MFCLSLDIYHTIQNGKKGNKILASAGKMQLIHAIYKNLILNANTYTQINKPRK